jgi:uncharacterized OB-fold protein
VSGELDDVEVPMLGRAGYGPGGRSGITPETEGHWRAAADRVFTLPMCDSCGMPRWPISPVCPSCHSLRWSWQPAPATGSVYTYTWIEQPEPARNVAVVELDEVRGRTVRVPGWVVDVDRSNLACGLRVQADFEFVADGVGVPFWRPVDDDGGNQTAG